MTNDMRPVETPMADVARIDIRVQKKSIEAY
jgi:hypothetical protein